MREGVGVGVLASDLSQVAVREVGGDDPFEIGDVGGRLAVASGHVRSPLVECEEFRRWFLLMGGVGLSWVDKEKPLDVIDT